MILARHKMDVPAFVCAAFARLALPLLARIERMPTRTGAIEYHAQLEHIAWHIQRVNA